MSQVDRRGNLQGRTQRLLQDSLKHARVAALAATLVPLGSVAVCSAVGQASASGGVPPAPAPEVICTGRVADDTPLWPPNHKWVSARIEGVTTSDESAPVITVLQICQDERVRWNGIGSGNTCPDGDGVGTDEAQIRRERNGNPKTPGNGRVYHIAYTATHESGEAECSGTVSVCIPHDQGRRSTCIDDGPLYDSTACDAPCVWPAE